MADYTAPGTHDFEAMTRQYWNLWGDALRQMGGASAPQAPGWQQALDWWSRMIPGGRPATDDLLGRFRHQSGDWFGLMQQVATRFAGQNAAPADITQAWKQMLGTDAVSGPWQEMFRHLQGGGAGGFEGWYRQITPWLEAMRRESERWLHVPTFGPAREHQERWQALALAQQEYQRRLGEYEQLMLRVAQLAFERFEVLLSERSEPGQQLTSARALFDLWIDAAEQAFAEVALSPEFRRIYGALTNAQMRLKLGVQREIEQVCVMLGMPSRTEVDSAHRKIAELERTLRRMQRDAGRATSRTESRTDARKGADTGAGASAPVAETEPQAVAPARSAPTRSQHAARSTRAKAVPPVKKKAVSASPKQRASDTARKRTPNAVKQSAVKKSAAKASSVKTYSVKKPAVKNPAAKPTVAKPAPIAIAAKPAKSTKSGTARKTSSAGVVSMKDWVARYAKDGNAPKGKSKRKGAAE